MCKIKRLNSNSFVLRLRYLQILFPPGSPYSSSLYCVPLLGFMVSAGFKIQSYCLLFSIDKYILHLDKYIFRFGQIHSAIWTNTLKNLDKYTLQFGQMHLAIWTNTFVNLDKCTKKSEFADREGIS